MNKKFSYPTIIKEIYLDSFGHMNNAIYLTLYEEARWDLITKNGYGIEKIRETRMGPTILEIKLKFLKELRARDEIMIETELLSYHNKIGVMLQKILKENEICSQAEIIFGLFDLKTRKLIPPTQEWLRAMGIVSQNDKRLNPTSV